MEQEIQALYEALGIADQYAPALSFQAQLTRAIAAAHEQRVALQAAQGRIEVLLARFDERETNP